MSLDLSALSFQVLLQVLRLGWTLETVLGNGTGKGVGGRRRGVLTDHVVLTLLVVSTKFPSGSGEEAIEVGKTKLPETED